MFYWQLLQVYSTVSHPPDVYRLITRAFYQPPHNSDLRDSHEYIQKQMSGEPILPEVWHLIWYKLGL